jgi:hypothetical protein
MKALSDALKKMLTGLAHQDAAEFLTTHEKMKILGWELEPRRDSSAPFRKTIAKPISKRIAFISDGRGAGAPLDYAIDSCKRQNAQMDLLIHGTVNTESIFLLEKQILQAGLEYRHIRLGLNAPVEILEYIDAQRSLIFLVATPDDTAVRMLIEEVIPGQRGRIDVPIVLIEQKPTTQPQPMQKSAA